jgi:hypothetical protein
MMHGLKPLPFPVQMREKKRLVKVHNDDNNNYNDFKLTFNLSRKALKLWRLWLKTLELPSNVQSGKGDQMGL